MPDAWAVTGAHDVLLAVLDESNKAVAPVAMMIALLRSVVVKKGRCGWGNGMTMTSQY